MTTPRPLTDEEVSIIKGGGGGYASDFIPRLVATIEARTAQRDAVLRCLAAAPRLPPNAGVDDLHAYYQWHAVAMVETSRPVCPATTDYALNSLTALCGRTTQEVEAEEGPNGVCSRDNHRAYCHLSKGAPDAEVERGLNQHIGLARVVLAGAEGPKEVA